MITIIIHQKCSEIFKFEPLSQLQDKISFRLFNCSHFRIFYDFIINKVKCSFYPHSPYILDNPFSSFALLGWMLTSLRQFLFLHLMRTFWTYRSRRTIKRENLENIAKTRHLRLSIKKKEINPTKQVSRAEDLLLAIYRPVLWFSMSMLIDFTRKARYYVRPLAVKPRMRARGRLLRNNPPHSCRQ